MPYPASRKLDLDRAASALRKALKTASGLLEAKDELTQLKAVHAVAQAAGALVRVTESANLEERLAALEASLERQGA